MKQTKKLPLGQGELDECSHNECDHVCERPKHTKGPWSVSVENSDLAKRSDYRIWVDNAELPNLSETSANARLIAAAPELLEALQSVLNWLQPLDLNLDDEQFRSDLKNIIKKATGGVE